MTDVTDKMASFFHHLMTILCSVGDERLGNLHTDVFLGFLRLWVRKSLQHLRRELAEFVVHVARFHSENIRK